jgi:1-acyl-sn-glycerol-3-phosphate acyltransferase
VSLAVDGLLRLATGLVCKIDARDLRRIPLGGPLLLVTNHVNFLDIPVVRARMRRHNLTALVKAETWDNPLMGLLFSHWHAIPIHRNSADFTALRAGLRALRENRILAIAPEGTRSQDGILRRANPGVSLIALWSGAPILPLAYWGHEAFGRNLRRGRRTRMTLRVGEPFRVEGNRSPGPDERQAIADQIMYRLAALMPPEYRGPYANPESAEADHIRPV